MNRDIIITLAAPMSDGGEEKTDVFATIESVSQSEFFAAAQKGFKPDYKISMWACEYSNQPYVIINGKKYKVYRTYERADEKVELYISERVGI